MSVESKSATKVKKVHWWFIGKLLKAGPVGISATGLPLAYH